MKKQDNRQFIISELSKKYKLCEFCLSRLTLKKPHLKSKNICFICKNIFQRTDEMVSRITQKLSSYQFSTFELGIILKPSLSDRDDHVKSEFQIIGTNSIKAGINHELAKKLSQKTNAILKHKNPDIIIKINFKDDSFEIISKPIFIYGRYKKKSRELVQKQNSCKQCSGNGCHTCNFFGLHDFSSVEGQIKKFLLHKFDSKQIKINWIGGEEKSSLVLGTGRPFFVKIINPKKRQKTLRSKIKLEGIELSELRKISEQPKGKIHFKSKIEILTKTENSINANSLNVLKKLQVEPIKILNHGKKNTIKQIYDIKFKKISSKLFKVFLYADGGIPIKSLVQNSTVIPNFSNLLQNKCECIQFDFKKIDVVS